MSIQDLLEEAKEISRQQANLELMREQHRQSVLAQLAMEAPMELVEQLIEILLITERKEEY